MNPRIDIHHHIVPPDYKSEFIDHRDMHPPLKNWTPERTIEDMDRGGVSTSIATVTTPGFWFGDLGQTRRLARMANDYAAGLAQRYPGRFGMFAALPLPDIEASLREIEYGLDVLGAQGIALFTSYRDRWLGDRGWDPVYEELNRRRAVVHVHPDAPACCVNIGEPDFRDSMIEYGTDTSRAIGHVIFGGAARRFPDIRFIWSHAGGTMPFIAYRFIREPLAKPHLKEHVPDGVLHELRRFHYDTAQAAHEYAMASLSRLVPATQVLFGTDWPYRTSTDHVSGLARCGCFDAAQLRAIDFGNAHRLMPALARSA